ncbi:MAG: hypothetical protein M3R60_01410 [Pseudomonadota bacterium]|nr:hypothetical protein [Pseudomonadota bacterium]
MLSHYRKRGEITCPVWLQVTDFDLYAFWLQPEMDGYFVASEELAFQLRRGGVEPARIHVQRASPASTDPLTSGTSTGWAARRRTTGFFCCCRPGCTGTR